MGMWFPFGGNLNQVPVPPTCTFNIRGYLYIPKQSVQQKVLHLGALSISKEDQMILAAIINLLKSVMG